MSFFKKLASDLSDDLSRLGIGSDKERSRRADGAAYPSHGYPGEWRCLFQVFHLGPSADCSGQATTHRSPTTNTPRILSTRTSRPTDTPASPAPNRTRGSTIIPRRPRRPKATTRRHTSQVTPPRRPRVKVNTPPLPRLAPARRLLTTRRRTSPRSRAAGSPSGMSATNAGIVCLFPDKIGWQWRP